MGDIEPPEPGPPRQAGILDILPSKEFATSRKGTLLIGEVVLSLIIFICFVASPWSSLVSGPLLEFLFAFFMLFAYSTKLNERFKDFHWPLMDFLRCVSASIIYFIISIISVSRSSHSASVAGGVFGFMATVVFAFDFYFIFNELIGFVRQGQQQSTEESPAGNPDNDSMIPTEASIRRTSRLSVTMSGRTTKVQKIRDH